MGMESMSNRQMNAVIRGVNEMIDDLNRDDVQAADNCGLSAWLRSDSTGLSSRYLATVLSGRNCKQSGWDGIDYPHDPGDFGRCLRLLRAAPELVPNLHLMADPKHGKPWNTLHAVWDELTALYEEESPSGKCPKLYDRMREVLSQAEKEGAP
jgi:hypothetical protein